MKKILLFGLLFWSIPISAQNLFWSFDDNQQPLTIAPECDARFDEVRGGVYMPSVEDVYHYGSIFLENQSYEIKRQAPYCFLIAAFNGHVDAQFKLAQMYNKGDVLPQDDLSAYKWAFIAALNGKKEAEDFVLTLEQFITTDDLEITNEAIQSTRNQIQQNLDAQLAALTAENQQYQAKQEMLNNPKVPTPTPVTNIFDNKDHFE